MVNLSVVIITYNEEINIFRCLQSLKGIAEEIIIVDSFSTDKTIEIGTAFNAKIVFNTFHGYALQKQLGVMEASNDFILSLDADEELTAELRLSILEIKKNPLLHAYKLARLTNYCGKWIKHCGWYPDYQIRLFDKTKGAWALNKVHESWQTKDKNSKLGILKGDLLHYSYHSISQHIAKIEKYSELSARDAVEKGKNASILKIFFSPKWHFFSEYILKLGILDGFYGYIICKMSAYSAFLKYTKIRLYKKM